MIRKGEDGELTGNLRVVSASSSFFFFMRSLRASASRRAIEIFCWMDSALPSAMAV